MCVTIVLWIIEYFHTYNVGAIRICDHMHNYCVVALPIAAKLVPVGYGINKLTISCVVEDDKVSELLHVCMPTLLLSFVLHRSGLMI